MSLKNMADLKKFFTDEQLSANKCTAFSENYEEALALEAQSVAIGSPGVVLNSKQLPANFLTNPL
jgi:hypothetical protein